VIAQRLLANAPLQIVQALVGFAAISAFTRALTPAEYGLYALLLSSSMLAHTLALTWAEAAAFRFLPNANDARARADHFATLLRIAGYAAMLAALALGAAFFAGAATALVAAIAAAFFRFITRLARESERADQRIGAYVGAEMAYVLAGFALGLVLLHTTSLGVAAPFAGLLLASALLFCRDAPKLWRAASGGEADGARAARYLRYGGPLAAALALDLALQAATRLILTLTHGAEAAGAYAAAFGLARPIDLACALLGASAAPLLLRAFEARDAEAFAALARRAAAALALIAMPAAAGLALIAEPLTHVMIGAGLQAEAARALPWLALAGFATGAALHFFSESFQLGGRTALRAALIGAAALVQLAATAWLAPTHGAAGAAMAAALGACLGAALLALVGARIVSLAPDWEALSKIALATAFMWLAVTSAPPQTSAHGELIVKIATGAGAYIIGLSLLHFGLIWRFASAVPKSLRGKVAAFQS